MGRDISREEYCFIYYLFLTVPERRDQTSPAILFIDGETGKIVECVRFLEKFGKDFSYIATYSLQNQTLRSVPGRPFSFSDRDVYPQGDGRRTFAARKYIAENVEQEWGEIYGF